jgi:hypothetical protein
MAQIDHAITVILNFLVDLFYLVFRIIAIVETWLRGELSHFGIPDNLQTVILVVVAIAVLLAALRLLGGVFRIVLVVLVLLIAAHLLLPLFHG